MQLPLAIRGLYAAFARYGLAARVVGCPHCELGAADAALHRVPLRQLSGDQLGVFAFKAMTTFGDVDDFRHFLPRIAELLTRGDVVGACDLGLLLRKLDYGAWTTWPRAEQEAIRAWLAAFEADFFADQTWETLEVEVAAHAARMRGAEEGLVARWVETRSELARRALAEGVMDAARRALKPAGVSATDAVLVPHAAALKACFERGLEAGEGDVLHRAIVDLAGPPFRYP